MELTEDNFFESTYQPLARAVRTGNVAAINQELARPLDVNQVGKQGMTLLMWAIVNRQPESLNQLLRKGANPNYKDAEGTQPVGYAAALDDISYLRLLLGHGGDPNSQDRGRPALITAILALLKDHVYLLLDKGADINTRDKGEAQVPAVMLLADLNQFADVVNFINRGADITLSDAYAGTLAYAVQNAITNPGTDAYTWQKQAKQLLMAKGVQFPVPPPLYVRKNWLPIRERWYQTPDGQPWQARMAALGQDPEGLGEKWREAHQAEKAALRAWMAANNILEPD